MLLFVLYNMLKALVGKTHSINELHSCQNHRQITLLFYIINFSMQDGVGSWKRRIRSDADTDADIFKKHFYIYVTVIFHN